MYNNSESQGKCFKNDEGKWENVPMYGCMYVQKGILVVQQTLHTFLYSLPPSSACFTSLINTTSLKMVW